MKNTIKKKKELILLVFYFLLEKYIIENLRVFLNLSVVLVSKNYFLFRFRQT